MLTQTDLLYRKFQWSDLEAVTELTNICFKHDGLPWHVSNEEQESEWRYPTFDPENECTLVFNTDGKLIAYGYNEKSSATRARGQGDCAVHPEYRGQGIGTRLIREGDSAFLAEVGKEFDTETPIYVHRWAANQEPTAIALFEAEGYKLVRHFYTMRIELKEPMQAPTMPEGFELRPFDIERDARTVHQAQQEAFRDHWGYVQDIEYEIWKHRFEEPHFQADMWHIAWTGNEVAGVSMCNPAGEGRDEVAWVGALGVRREYRNRGLAKALLLHSFYDAQQRGFEAMELGVDALNPTGALGLYERAGMHTSLIHSSYRKVLRGNPELIKD
jgi:mycothiol synthase